MKNEKKFKGVYLDQKSGKYYVSTTFTTSDGFEIKKCKRGFNTQREANLWKEQQRVFYAENSIGACGVVKTPTEALVDKYIDSRRKVLKKNSMVMVECYSKKYFLAFFKNKKLSDLKPSDINDYYSYIIEQKIKNTTKNAILSHTLSLVEWLDLMEYITPTIARKFKLILIKLEVADERVNDYLEKEEIDKLLDSYGTSKKEKMNKLMVTAFIYSGLRHSEMLALQYKDIDYENCTISVTKQLVEAHRIITIQYSTKTSQNKVVDIPTFVVELFQEYQQITSAKDDDFIFTNEKGDLLGRYISSYDLKKHLEKAGLKQVRIHDLRHTFCTLLFDSKMFDDTYISKQMGHSSPATSHKVYEHITKERSKENKEKIELLR